MNVRATCVHLKGTFFFQGRNICSSHSNITVLAYTLMGEQAEMNGSRDFIRGGGMLTFPFWPQPSKDQQTLNASSAGTWILGTLVSGTIGDGCSLLKPAGRC